MPKRKKLMILIIIMAVAVAAVIAGIIIKFSGSANQQTEGANELPQDVIVENGELTEDYNDASSTPEIDNSGQETDKDDQNTGGDQNNNDDDSDNLEDNDDSDESEEVPWQGESELPPIELN